MDWWVDENQKPFVRQDPKKIKTIFIFENNETRVRDMQKSLIL